ncbi:MAG: four helix bundle protein [Polyangiales bacterium]
MNRINVYEQSRNVVRQIAPLVHVVQRLDRSLADQLKRAAQSMVLNIAEARGTQDGNARTRFGTACGSAKETRAALSIAADWGYVDNDVVKRIDAELDRICAITWTLSRRR